MELLLDEMEEALTAHSWLVGDNYTIADAAFTPYLARLEHLNILAMTDGRPHVQDWYERIKARPSFTDAIVRWENAKYMQLMKTRGAESWPKIQEIIARSSERKRAA
jgi:glutathione S-transferase